jgi:cytochrome c-type biogenesis protein
VAEPFAQTPLWRHSAFLGPLAVAGVAAASASLWWGPLSAWLVDAEFAVAGLVDAGRLGEAAWFLLPAVGFGCGLLASFSPCVLPLVPLNLATIGVADATGKRAVSLSARFVLGSALALATLGLLGDVAGFLLIEQRGPVWIVAGLGMIAFGLVALEVVPAPFAGRALGSGRSLGPVGAGAVFALVTSPCASPLIGGVLAAATAAGVPGLPVAAMVGFALGYTALVFVTGVFGASLLRRLPRTSLAAPRAAAAALLLVLGVVFTALGIEWF